MSMNRLTNGTIAVHAISVGFGTNHQAIHAFRKIGVAKTTRRIPGTIQVAGFVVVAVVPITVGLQTT